MSAPPPDYPRLVVQPRAIVSHRHFTLADLLTLVTCGAVGLAISRWLNWHAYQWNRVDATWLLHYGLLPLVVGMLNLGQFALYGLHCHQRRRSTDLSPSEFPGMVASGAMGVMVGFTVLFPYARAAGMMMMLGVLLTLTLACCFAVGGVIRQLCAGEKLSWPEWLGAAAAILPGGTLVYTIVSEFPVC